jgi:hypothetical protein
MQIIDHTGKRLTLADVAALESAPDANQSPDILSAFTTEETTLMPNDPTIIVTRMRLTNFRGLATLDVPIGPGGAIFSGTNGEGKTTAIESLPATLEGVGIGPECIRIGADKTELLIDMDKVEEGRRTKLEAKRTITKSKTTLSLTGADGVPLPRPKEQLAALFGGRALDPLKFYLADAKEQRRIVLAANPVQVTVEDLTRWTGEEREWNTSGHGQEVLARVRQMYFDQRTKAGQVADQAKAAVTVKAQESDKLRVEKTETMTPEAARTHVAAAESKLAVLNDRRKQAQEREQAAAGTRAKVAELRAKAEELMARPDAVGPSAEDFHAADGELRAATIALEDARRRCDAAKAAVDTLEANRKAANALETEATTAINQANQLEAALAADEDMPALAEITIAAETALATAKALVINAEATAKWTAAKAQVVAAELAQHDADAAWIKLDTIVKTLTVVAPAEIAGRADLVAGLEVTPDSILLDGKDITLLCGSEKMSFAVTLAKRVAGKAKMLTVDGLEQIAPAKQPQFVRMCLEGEWMLFATLVSDGAMVVVDCFQFAKAA